MSDPQIIGAWSKVAEIALPFLSTLIWQIILVVIVFSFRSDISALIKRIKTITGGGVAIECQPSDPDAIAPGGKAETEAQLLDSEGFFTKEGITQLIQDSGLVQKGERVKELLLLFQTEKQHTWLVTTDKRLFCILDDENTQATSKFIQWRIALDEASLVSVRAHKRTVGLVDIGPRTRWLYSRHLYPNADKLKQEIESMVSKAKHGRA